MLAAASAAGACECASRDLAQRAALAELIVVGKVTAHTPLESVTIAPVEVLKGAAPGTLRIRTGRSDCDFFLPRIDPRVGDEYLLYLTRSGGELTANRCLGQGRVADKTDDLRALRRR